MRSLMRSLKSIFGAGLFSLIIIILIIWLIKNLLRPIATFLKLLRDFLFVIIQHRIPASEFILFIVIILILGAIALLLSRRASSKFPFINRVISFSKTAIELPDLLKKGKWKSVMVKINEDVSLFGFTSGKSRKINDQEIIRVLLPSTPNPTTGYTFVFPKEKVIFLPQEWNKFVINTIFTAGLLE